MNAKKKRPEKESMLRQYLVTVYLADDVHEDVPNATVTGARDAVWARHGNADARFRVTRAEVRRVWSDDDEMECDQLVIVCDYVAKGANGADARVKIKEVLDGVGVSWWGIRAQETAVLRMIEPFAVPEDLPTLGDVRRRIGV
jgi:hypothetical protein